MEERKLTRGEEAEARKLSASMSPHYGLQKFWTIFLVCVGLFIFVLLFSIVYFIEGKSFYRAAGFGLFGVFFFIAIVICNLLAGRKRGESEYEKKLKLDLKEKNVVIKTIKVVKAWRCFDPGYNKAGEENLLFKTVDGRWICVPGEDIELEDDKRNPKSEIKLHLLKNSRHDIKVEFSGERIPLAKKIIDVKNEWRNDDLRYNEVFGYKRFSENLRKQIEE